MLVTGASGGLGRSLVAELGRAGAAVILTGRHAGRLAAGAESGGGRVIVCDLTDADAVARLVDQAGTVDVLIANAAIPASGAVVDLNPTVIDRALDVNLRVPIQLARAVVPGMVANGSGHVVFISSLGGLAASPGSAVYNATKFGVRGFSLGLRQDLAGSGVGVSVILPGFIRDAGMFAQSGVTLPRGVGTRSAEQVARATIRAIVRNRAETVVAPVPLALGAYLSGAFPGPAALVQRALGGERISGRIAAGQRDLI